MTKKELCGLSLEEIYDLISLPGYSRAHALSLSHGIYKKAVMKLADISGVPARLKRDLSINYISGILTPSVSEKSSDGSVKYLFRASDGKEFESVFIPESKRKTVCISTQSGCRMGCRFCATARYGFHGNLNAGEMISQILGIPEAKTITHAVFMGMGEPLDNIENVLKACRAITAEWGLSLSPRHVTVSTVGLTPGVGKFISESSCNLTLSLFTPFREERADFAPVERKYPVHDILELMKAHKLNKKRRFSVAYIMIGGMNDSESHLAGLKNLLAGSDIRVNLLPYHQTGDCLKSSSDERMQYFRHNLVMSGISASIRKSRGKDISAACGLLASGLKSI